MKTEILALIIQESSRFIGELIKNRPPRQMIAEQRSAMVIQETPMNEELPIEENKAQSIEAGCVPCAIGHFGTCSGLLNEATRFARKDGIDSSEVIDRVNMCLDELNSMERIDLRPELTLSLPQWEKELAERALADSRNTRHGLESLSSAEDLERVAAITQSTRQEVGRAWFKQKLANTSPEEKKKIAEKAMKRIEGE